MNQPLDPIRDGSVRADPRYLEGALERLQPSANPDYEGLLADALAVITSPAFPNLPTGEQAAAIHRIFFGLLNAGHAQAGAVADVLAPHVAQLMRREDLTLADACRVHDGLWALWWVASTRFSDMRRTYRDACVPFHAYLEARGLTAPRPGRVEHRPTRIAYLLHYGHFNNAVAPLLSSLAAAHAGRRNQTVHLYAVQWVDPGALEAVLEGSGVVLRTFSQEDRYDRLDEIAQAFAEDRIDVAMADSATSITGYLFSRRVAPLQYRIDLGVPCWHMPEVDAVMLGGKPAPGLPAYPRKMMRRVRMSQDSRTVLREPDPVAVQAVRATFPADAVVLATFTRLIKVTPEYLDVVRQILLARPLTHFLVVGTGDPRLVQTFMAEPALEGRISFIHHNVDLAVYGAAVDIFLDTFPFMGGLACREVSAQGRPILALEVSEWSVAKRLDRDRHSVAHSVPDLLAMAKRMIDDPAYRRKRGEAGRRAIQRVTRMEDAVRDVEAAIRRDWRGPR